MMPIIASFPGGSGSGRVQGTKTIEPTAEDQTIYPDDGYQALRSVVVKKISYVESANEAGGTTVEIG